MINLLVSYAFMRKSLDEWFRCMAWTRGGIDYLVDSGAFSAFTIGEKLDLDHYMRVCKALDGKVWGYIQLDVINNVPKTDENLERMYDFGLNPMPVLILDHDVERFDKLIERADRVCVAGGVSESDDWYGARIEQCRRRADATGRRVLLHGLGYTRNIGPLKSGIDTVDSSTWVVGQRYGKFSMFYRTRGCVQMDFKQLRRMPWANLPPEIRDYLVASGITPEDLTSEKANSKLSLIHFITTDAWFRFANMCRERGIKFFFAVGNSHHLITISLVANNRRRNGIDYAGIQKDMPMVRDLFDNNREKFYGYLLDGARKQTDF